MKPGDFIQVQMGDDIGVACALYVGPCQIAGSPTGAHVGWASWRGRLQQFKFLGSAIVEAA